MLSFIASPIGTEQGESKTYCAHENALSRASRVPPINGTGGSGSKAIHQPTGILTVFIPCLYRNWKSSIVIKLFLCLCSFRRPINYIDKKTTLEESITLISKYYGVL
jgi:hypothetical protein